MKCLWCFLVLILCLSCVHAKNNKGKSKQTSSKNKPVPNIIEIDLALQNSLKEVAVSSMKNPTSNNDLPNNAHCGLQHTDDRFYDKADTALDEFPWLVDIVHQDEISICPGVLITDTFVLTGYGCGLFSYKVRLGLYHTKQKISCVMDSHIQECSEPVLESKVEKEMFTNSKGDIALLKLVDKVTYSDYVRPICLPFDESIRPNYGKEVIASGWGQNIEDGKGTSKKRLLFKLTSPEECKTIDRNTQLNENDNQFCFISEEKRNDVGCIDDYGGPIMYTHKHKWYVEGILIGPYNRNMTYGYCSESIKPIYGKKITSDILSWIIKTVSS